MRRVAIAVFALASAVVPALAAAQPEREAASVRSLTVVGPSGSEQRVVIVRPRNPGQNVPVVIALHGQGEAMRGEARGPLGWAVDYALVDAFDAMRRGQLDGHDYRGFVSREHLISVNSSLRSGGFSTPIVVCPYTPDFLSNRADDAGRRRFLEWLAGPLLEQVREAYPEAGRTRTRTGIDGVSLGGWLALEAGFRFPHVFGSVGAIQPAIAGDEAFVELDLGDAPPAIRLLSSDDDPFLGPTRRLSSRLRASRVSHRLVVLPGTHSYRFNRGPGSVELLRFASEALSSALALDSGRP